MGMLEQIDWDKLGEELYGTIAHASAGTDFDAPDLQMAVGGCIEKFKRAINVVEENGSSHNGAIVLCPTCGSACFIGGDDEEGTHYYVPVVPLRAQRR